MPTYRITSPEGKVYNVTGNGTKEEALAQFQAQMGAKSDVQTPTPVAAEEPSFLGDLVKGAKAGLDNTALGIKGLLPQSVQDAGDWIDSKIGNGEKLTKDTAVQAPDSAGGLTGNIGSQVLMGLAPGAAVGRGANLLKLAMAARGAPAVAGSAAALGANVAGNAGAAAATAPENRGTAAMWGAGGAVVGEGASRVLGGAFREAVSPEAKTLMDAGVHLTPGQALTGPNAGLVAQIIRNTEDKLTSVPFLGDVIANAQSRSLKSFNVAKINEAVKPLGLKIKNAGITSIQDLDDQISAKYTDLLPSVSVDKSAAKVKLVEVLSNMKDKVVYFDDLHANKLDQYLERFVMPYLKDEAPELGGSALKKLDSELGDLARKGAAKGGLSQGPLGEATLLVRNALREAYVGKTPEATSQLKLLDKVFAHMIPITTAAEKRATGVFTPLQLADALKKTHNPLDDVTQAGRQVLPNSIPDSGTAGRAIMANMLHPGGLGAGTAAAGVMTGFTPALYAGLGTAALYSKAGMAGLTKGVHPMVAALRKKLGTGTYDPAETEMLLSNLIGRTAGSPGQE